MNERDSPRKKKKEEEEEEAADPVNIVVVQRYGGIKDCYFSPG